MLTLIIKNKKIIEKREYEKSFYNKIILSEGIEKIEDFAFHRCEDLVKIVLPSTLESIGAFAFRDCPMLSSITLPDKLSEVGDCAFSPATNKDLIIYIRKGSPLHLLIETDNENVIGLTEDFVREHIKYIDQIEEEEDYNEY